MFSIQMVQAGFGDCFLVEFGTPGHPRHILIDGGPPAVYEQHLRPVLKCLAGNGGVLDLVVLSHVDNDHAVGLLDYFAEMRDTPGPNSGLPAVSGLWHNSFSRTIDRGSGIERRLQSLMTASRAQVMSQAGNAVNGIREGAALRTAALALGIPINAGFEDGLITVETARRPLKLGNLLITIATPAGRQLEELQTKWREWLDKHEEAIANDEFLVMANSDASVPNLSSIGFLMEADGKKALFTGDGRSDHLLKGLEQARLLSDGKLHVDLLKLAHHGSSRNTTKKFFRSVTADLYAVSANGRDGNPDLATLIWIVEAAREQGRKITITATNATPSIKQLKEEYNPATYGYKLQILPPARHSIKLSMPHTA